MQLVSYKQSLIINTHSIGNFSKQASLNELSINKIFHLIYFTLNFLYSYAYIRIVPRVRHFFCLFYARTYFIHDIEGALYYEYSENLST